MEQISTTILQALTTLQPNELSQPAENGQNISANNVVAVLADGRKIKQVNDIRLEVTTYKGRPASDAEIAEQIERLRRNYTQMAPDFWATLIGELETDKWPAKRIADAVSHTLRVKTGGFLSVADIMSYDKPMRLYTHSGYCWLINNGKAKDNQDENLSDFGKVYINKGTPKQKCFFYLKKDLPIRQ